MKGVILAGGLGTRLNPLTQVTNKHLLPIYDRPMIFYPLRALVEAGIRDILIVTGGNNAGDFLKLIGNGAAFGLKHINYTYQKGEGGIAEALGLAEHFSGGEKIAVVLGDNIFERSLKPFVDSFKRQKSGAKILIQKVADPQRFGVVSFKGKKVLKVTEKPKRPDSAYIVTGIYMYDAEVFRIVKTLKPSGRGELEITDVNNAYIRAGRMTCDILPGWWTDSGTFESLLRAGQLVARDPSIPKPGRRRS
ncbi:MAG: spore coat protein [Candidatus Omnitrophica bacterium CG11_big_fil_rev_8_21_14_0_20_64_10]|nr:MAG: spore coat protein [Candidatus Omnitrophica bacterium CG11_big_fil_rev_8_21_14_0_20_64_10]